MLQAPKGNLGCGIPFWTLRLKLLLARFNQTKFTWVHSWTCRARDCLSCWTCRANELADDGLVLPLEQQYQHRQHQGSLLLYNCGNRDLVFCHYLELGLFISVVLDPMIGDHDGLQTSNRTHFFWNHYIAIKRGHNPSIPDHFSKNTFSRGKSTSWRSCLGARRAPL